MVIQPVTSIGREDEFVAVTVVVLEIVIVDVLVVELSRISLALASNMKFMDAIVITKVKNVIWNFILSFVIGGKRFCGWRVLGKKLEVGGEVIYALESRRRQSGETIVTYSKSQM